MHADRAMRTVRFALKDRLAVVPVELVHAGRWLLLLLALSWLGGLVTGRGGPARSLGAFAPWALAVVIGAVVVPVLLPWLPLRSFAAQGWLVGVAGALLYALGASATRWPELLSWLLLIPAVAAFVSLNYTGASTFTSLSGVKRETRRAIPLIVASIVAGLAVQLLWRV
jgi:acetyl-CoA decarbonylase/synthase complex subunit gamma